MKNLHDPDGEVDYNVKGSSEYRQKKKNWYEIKSYRCRRRTALIQLNIVQGIWKINQLDKPSTFLN